MKSVKTNIENAQELFPRSYSCTDAEQSSKTIDVVLPARRSTLGQKPDDLMWRGIGNGSKDWRSWMKSDLGPSDHATSVSRPFDRGIGTSANELDALG